MKNAKMLDMPRNCGPISGISHECCLHRMFGYSIRMKFDSLIFFEGSAQ
ncbi:MAG: hypothetical protein N838_08700 [Thiohalocapsa sp. PB-PSB1]|nr:MAG: hypothetical protein N838_08700 [Thiohalocapsa sp. PB-PSB1]